MFSLCGVVSNSNHRAMRETSTQVMTKSVPPRASGIDTVLSPRRKTTRETTPEGLAQEQLLHFGIDPESEFGTSLRQTAENLYAAHNHVGRLWEITLASIGDLDRTDRIAWFNAKKFLCFQMAKVLDTFQNPFRKAFQSLEYSDGSLLAKGPYPIFDNVTALFSANPVIVRTATYIYACTEWVDDAFHGREALHEIYSRLLNPTSISLANYIVEIEAGALASEYLAWNFNSGMAAIDGLLSHVLDHGDILIVSRNVYGGTHQLLHDHFASQRKLGIRLEWFDGYTEEDFAEKLAEVQSRHSSDLAAGKRLHVFVESPCNPHGYVLDVPGICLRAHQVGGNVMLDSTVATPFLSKPLQRADPGERPDYVIHSYTKDLTGNGNATAGCVIAKNHLMFIPKGDEVEGIKWNETLFWGVYYVKGAFLDADKAFEVISGMKTLELRMMQKCVNTLVLARVLDSHPLIRVHSNAIAGNSNYELRSRLLRFGFPAPLFTIDFEGSGISREAFVSFFDSLAPTFHHQVSLGQSNTTILCPALTSHSELDRDALVKAGIATTNIRIAVGDENPRELIAHFVCAAKLVIDPELPDFSSYFMRAAEVDDLHRRTYLDAHLQYVDNLNSMDECMN
jgi:O-acetylhomoserine (thiol)-lyase